MENVLNRGLNFCIQPLKLDLTQILVDFSQFERTMIWKEFWFNRESEDNNKKYSIFKSKKSNLPKNHKTPKGLTVFLSAFKSEITDPQNRKQVICNLPDEEMKALKQLIQLQKEKQIIIKPCDKGAGLIILNFQDYINTCLDHLNSKQENIDSEIENNFYKQVEPEIFITAQQRIISLLEEGYDNNWISKEEFQAMNPTDKKAGKFYCVFKVHKEHKAGSVPPPRPIVDPSWKILVFLWKTRLGTWV